MSPPLTLGAAVLVVCALACQGSPARHAADANPVAPPDLGPNSPRVASVSDTHLTEDQAITRDSLAALDSVTAGRALVDSLSEVESPSAYPELPNWAVRWLEEMSCVIPQSQTGERGRTNVISGTFIPDAPAGWAVLCLDRRAGESAIVVFSGDSLQRPQVVGRHDAVAFVHAGTSGRKKGVSWSRKIGLITPQEALDWCIYPDTGVAHEGVIDLNQGAFLGAYYLRTGSARWIDCHPPDGE